MSAGDNTFAGKVKAKQHKRAKGDDPKAAISFTVAVDGEKARRFRIAPGKRPVKVGRGPQNDVVLTLGGVSAHHLDILAVHNISGRPVLAVRDASTNGTGLLSSPGNPALRLAKDASVEVLSSSTLLVPFNVKPVDGKDASELRVSLEVCVCEEVASTISLAGKRPSCSASVGDAVPSKRNIVGIGASSAVVEDMMARCRAFAAEKEREREHIGLPIVSAGCAASPQPPPPPLALPAMPQVHPQFPHAGFGGAMPQGLGIPMGMPPFGVPPFGVPALGLGIALPSAGAHSGLMPTVGMATPQMAIPGQLPAQFQSPMTSTSWR